MQLTVLGGSSVAVPELVAALIPYVHGDRSLAVVLHGRTADKLALVGRVCQQMAAALPGFQVEFTTDLEQALTGADIVLNQVRVGGLDARIHDETFPQRWDIPGEETVGPGGVANALRTVPVVLDMCRTIERFAPDCTLLTFSNPSSVVQRAIAARTSLRVIGLCDAPESMHRAIARALSVDPAALETQYVGMHHFGWITSVLYGGDELLPELLARDEPHQAVGLPPGIGRAFGVLPHPYFRYFLTPERMLAAQRQRGHSRAEELKALEDDLLAAYANHQESVKPPSVERRSAVWYPLVVAPVVAALAYGQPARLALNLRNEGAIPQLPPDTVVEITATISGTEVSAVRPDPLPPPILLGALAANAAYEQALVDAILLDSPTVLLQALIMSPLVPSYDIATELLAELWPRRGWPPEHRS